MRTVHFTGLIYVSITLLEAFIPSSRPSRWMVRSSAYYSAQLLHELRKPNIINYNTKLYPFREAIIDILNEDSRSDNSKDVQNGRSLIPKDSDLSSLHIMSDSNNDDDDLYHIDKSGNRVARYQYQWNKNRDRLHDISKSYQHFEMIYLSFINNIIGKK